ncbi:hypothetical protein BaRGS_00028201 [Batillaria attramentaria]|uniref:Uncharacterized protein n=1 Tax=Batillaria attramentaria TaxID=370345 RepID=A0ABD0K0K0_9CAEN
MLQSDCKDHATLALAGTRKYVLKTTFDWTTRNSRVLKTTFDWTTRKSRVLKITFGWRIRAHLATGKVLCGPVANHRLSHLE